jgi:hypothetical protein
VGRHAVLAAIFGRYGDHDGFTFGARQAAFAFHQNIVVRHKGAKVFGAQRIRAKDVRNESDLRAVCFVNAPNVLGKRCLLRFSEARRRAGPFHRRYFVMSPHETYFCKFAALSCTLIAIGEAISAASVVPLTVVVEAPFTTFVSGYLTAPGFGHAPT